MEELKKENLELRLVVSSESARLMFFRNRIDNLSQMFQRQIIEMKADAKKKFDDENLFLKYQVILSYLLIIDET